MKKAIVVSTLALSVHTYALVALNRRIEPFMYHYYVLSWWSYIFLVDSILSLRHHRFLVANKRPFFLSLISSAFWCFFEILNLRLKNWFYVNIPDSGWARYVGYLVAFGTVMPGILVTKEAVRHLVGDVNIRPIRLAGRLSILGLSGASTLVLIIVFPRFLFPLTWVFLIPVMDGINYRRGYASFTGDLEQGKAGDLISTILAGIICGFLWEVWNYWAISKWVYTVPLFEDVKLFEMPVLGYLGFAFFAVETVAFFNFFNEARLFTAHAWAVAFIALILSLVTSCLIDRYTVFSRPARVDQLQFISDARRAYLERRGVRSTYAIDRSVLDPDENRFLDLVEVKGLGLDHALQLKQNGIDSIAGLSGISPDKMCAIIGEEEKRRCRIYIKAAGGPLLDY